MKNNAILGPDFISLRLFDFLTVLVIALFGHDLPTFQWFSTTFGKNMLARKMCKMISRNVN
jgi:hypothetical protein